MCILASPLVRYHTKQFACVLTCTCAIYRVSGQGLQLATLKKTALKSCERITLNHGVYISVGKPSLVTTCPKQIFVEAGQKSDRNLVLIFFKNTPFSFVLLRRCGHGLLLLHRQSWFDPCSRLFTWQVNKQPLPRSTHVL